MVEPPCKKCKKAGLKCFEKRPLRWAGGATYRGKAGTSSAKIASGPSMAVGENCRTTSTRGCQTFAMTRDQSVIVGTDLEGTDGITVDDAEALEPSNLSIPSSLDDPSIIGLDRTSRYYLYYCKSVIVQVFLYLTQTQIANVYASCSSCMTATRILYGL
jgi:hypothetical protein